MPHDSIGIIEFTDYAPAFSFLNKILQDSKIKFLNKNKISDDIISLIFEGNFDLLNKEFNDAKIMLKNGELFSECIIKDPHVKVSNIFLKGN